MNSKLGYMIDYYRRQNKMTLEELGKKLDKSPSAISRWISGARSPMVDDLIKLTELFDTDIETLMYGQSSEKNSHNYTYYDACVSAGIPLTIEAINEEAVRFIELPDNVMGKHARSKDIFIMRANGESMNRVIPHNSLIAVKKWSIESLKRNDIVVFADNGEYSIKRYINDEKNRRLIFRPDSTDDSFSDHIVNYENASNLKLIGKVVLSIVHHD